MPAAIASRQVTPPVECTSTSAAASRSGILSVKLVDVHALLVREAAPQLLGELLVAPGEADDAA